MPIPPPVVTTFLTAPVTFFDYIVVALLAWMQYVVGLMPLHNSAWSLSLIIINTARIVFKIAFVLVKANFNLGPMIMMLTIIIWFNFLMLPLRLGIGFVRMLKWLIPFL